MPTVASRPRRGGATCGAPRAAQSMEARQRFDLIRTAHAATHRRREPTARRQGVRPAQRRGGHATALTLALAGPVVLSWEPAGVVLIGLRGAVKAGHSHGSAGPAPGARPTARTDRTRSRVARGARHPAARARRRAMRGRVLGGWTSSRHGEARRSRSRRSSWSARTPSSSSSPTSRPTTCRSRCAGSPASASTQHRYAGRSTSAPTSTSTSRRRRQAHAGADQRPACVLARRAPRAPARGRRDWSGRAATRVAARR